MLICQKKVDEERAFAIELRSDEPSFVVEDSLLVWALTSLPSKFDKEEALRVWSTEERARAVAEEIWEYAVAEGLILSVQDAGPIAGRCDLWRRIGWPEAGIYHEGTRDYPFVDMSHKGAFLDDNERMKDYEDQWLAPSVYQSFPALRNVPLEKVTEEYADYLDGKREPDGLDTLSLLFDFCFGERNHLKRGFDEQKFLQLESLRKTIPSGGGRHPTEVFMAVFRPALGLSAGLYHYNVHDNCLELLREEELFGAIQEALPAPLEVNGERPDAVMFFTSICERAMWRYRDPRSWRAFVIDIGHAEYMFSEMCGALDIEVAFCHGISSEATSRLLAVDPYRQPVMSAAALTFSHE